MTTNTCGWCGKPLDDGTENSHGICPDCIREHFPEYADEVLDDGFERAADCVSGYGND